MKRMLLFLFLLSAGFVHSYAQTIQIKGRVVEDSTAGGIANVSVSVAETKQGTSTDNAGNFSVTVTGRRSVTLQISSIGYRSASVTTNGASPLVITLRKEQTSAGDEVVVIGYSSVRRRDLTGSISSVGARQLKDIPLSNAAEALTGKLAGVQVTSTEGAPGADIIIRVRGGGSITQDNSPIYIVDGIQVENALSVISPQDIASVDVLKDASTTAIYGARGANGVVIITTKGGRAGRTVVSYNGSAGYRQIAKEIDVLNPYEFVLWQYERSKLVNDTSFNRTYGSTWDTLQNYKNVPFINWQDKVFGRKAFYQNHNFSVNGGDKNTTFNLSATENKEDGILLESGFDRKLLNLKLDHRASDKFRIGLTARYLDQVINGAGTSNSGTRITNRLRPSIEYRPFEIPTVPSIDVFDEDYYQRSAGIINPVLLTKAEYRKAYQKSFNVSGYISYNILKNLTFRSTAGFDNTYARQDQFFSKITATARSFSSLPDVMLGTQNSTTINNSNTLQYTLSNIATHHNIDVLVGEETYETRSKSLNIETRYLPADITAEKALANVNLGSPPSGTTQPAPRSAETPPSRIFSLFSRVNYSYDNKYLVSLSARADRSSKFRYENGLLVFPSGSAAWRFSQEKFMDRVKWLSDGKIRAGFGTAGNNRIGDLLYLQLYGVTGEYALNHTILPGFAPVSLSNENLKWERTLSKNIGLDLAFFNNRVNFTMDIYKNSGKDLLLAVAIPPTTGYSSQLQNLGSTSNKGIEFQISAVPVQNRKIIWNTNFNISFNRNRVESLGGISQQTRNSGWQGSDGLDDYLVRVGDPVGLMYGFVTDGMYKIDDFIYSPPTGTATVGTYTLKAGVPNGTANTGTLRPGVLKFRDINKDGNITADDRAVIGRANPKFTGGWNNQFSFKNWDVSLFVNFVYGNDIYNANKIEWTDGTFPNLNMLGSMRNRWRNINDQGVQVTDPAELAKLNPNPTQYSPPAAQRFFLRDDVIEDGSFLRLNNMTLGYTLPKGIVKRARISSFRLYATVNNLAVLTHYSGFDPEVTDRTTDPLTPGVDFGAYPKSRTWVFGLNVNF